MLYDADKCGDIICEGPTLPVLSRLLALSFSEMACSGIDYTEPSLLSMRRETLIEQLECIGMLRKLAEDSASTFYRPREFYETTTLFARTKCFEDRIAGVALDVQPSFALNLRELSQTTRDKLKTYLKVDERTEFQWRGAVIAGVSDRKIQVGVRPDEFAMTELQFASQRYKTGPLNDEQYLNPRERGRLLLGEWNSDDAIAKRRFLEDKARRAEEKRMRRRKVVLSSPTKERLSVVTVESLMREQLTADFKNSPIGMADVQTAFFEALGAGVAAGVLRYGDLPAAAYKLSVGGMHIDSAGSAGVLQGEYRVACATNTVAAVATLLSMRHERQINVRVGQTWAQGASLMRALGNQDFEFAIVGLPAYCCSDNKAYYSPVLPCNWEGAYAVHRPNPRPQEGIRAVAQGGAGEVFDRAIHPYDGFRLHRIAPEDIYGLAEDDDPRKYVLLWERPRILFERRGWVIDPEVTFRIWGFLYARNDLLASRLAEVVRFRQVFQAEWERLRKDQDKAVRLLIENHRYRRAFIESSGRRDLI